jgi:hypothetical protein
MPPQYTDDLALGPQAVLWRAINPLHIKPDGSVSSAAYKTQSLSVYVLAETTPATLAAKFPSWPFQAFTAKVARDAGCIIVPVPDRGGDTSHREIRRASNPEARLSAEALKIRAAATWVNNPHVPPPPEGPPSST